MQIKSMTLAKGILSVTAISLLTGCVDDKYDLNDIDKTSRFTVDNLTVPVNLETLTLKNVIDIDDDDPTIKIETVNGQEIYTIKKDGNIDPTEFSLGTVTVAEVPINSVNIGLPDLDNLPTIPGFKVDFKETLDLPVKEDDMQTYNFNLDNIDKALKSLKNIHTSPITIKVVLSVPGGLLGGVNKISFEKINLKLPKGLMNVKGAEYDSTTDLYTIPNLPVESNGKATLEITADGLDLTGQNNIDENHNLPISGQIGVKSAKIYFDVKQVEFPKPFNIGIDYSVSSFDVESFTGTIDYDMDDIKIDPISLDDLPDFLNNDKTNIIIDNPAIFVRIVNPVGKYGLNGKGKINLNSNFTNGTVGHSGQFDLVGEESKLAFCSDINKFTPPAEYADYKPIVIDGLDKVLTNGNDGLPKSISVSVTDLNFSGNDVELPLGDLGVASGEYNFSAPFAFGQGTKIYYNTTENGWGSDDLDDVNVTLIKLHALCTSKLPVDVELKVQPIDKDGNIIDIEESAPFKVPANCTNELATLQLKGKNGKPIKDFDGVIFEATIEQNDPNAQALGPNIELELKDLRITVDGYYETKF